MIEFRKIPYLFSAIVGQAEFKTAYLANIVNPKIGGLLISGPKGTGKSTVVHSIETILPQYDSVDGCPFNCDPLKPERFCTLCREREQIKSVSRKMKIITLPLSCTEDRLIGSIDIEKLIKGGEKKIQAGLLGEANRNILYIDEVNLLPDHLVDDILDAAASPWNTIEREGFSIIHPADFILVGTMNPEEGELRPQILDRFPLCVKITSIHDPQKRMEIVKRNLLYENDPEKFAEIFQKDENTYADIIARAKELLPDVQMNELMLAGIAEACSELKVDGQRPDIIIVKTAQTIAALDRRMDIGESDILLAAQFALSHRTRDGGLLEPPNIEEINTVFTKCLKTETSSRTGEKPSDKFSNSSININLKTDSFLDKADDKADHSDVSPDDITLKKR